ncbi:MAG: alanine racemase [Candidatus Zixiibacteriota bacterium]|nr:MAG: alanine racemase [candidate division Zixibacteria bacterium]
MPKIIDHIDTPVILIEKSILEKNIRRMQQLADGNGVKLRVHIKSHKVPALARMQLRAGATGIAVAKLGEAEVMADAGIKDIQIANIIVGPEKIKRLVRLHGRCRLTLAVDSIANAKEVSDAFSRARKSIDVLIKINTGLNRCGLDSIEDVGKLAGAIRTLRGIRLRGLMTHAGHAYAAHNKSEIRRIGISEGEKLVECAARLRNLGYPIEVISAGSTPTARLCSAVKGVTELRVGNYMFNDMVQVSLKVTPLSNCAVTILSTVISRPTQGRAIIDAGSKALSRDRGAHGTELTMSYGKIIGGRGVLKRLSEEHGIIENATARFRIGQKIRIIPNHACAVMNLFDQAYLVDGDKVIKKLEISARGKMT